MGFYCTAEVCLNGHCSTSYVEESPEVREKYCSKCGSKTITTCQHCNAKIRGSYTSDLLLRSSYTPPKFCPECGNPYPWTEKALTAAKELIIMSDVNEEVKDDLIKELANVAADTPRTNVIAIKFSQFIKDAVPVIGSAIKDLIINIGSEALCKSMGLN